MSDDLMPLASPASLKNSFAFVLNVNSLIDCDKIELAPGHVLRRAEKQEVYRIKEWLQRSPPVSGFSTIDIRWETERAISSGALLRLPADKFRYFVVAFDGDNGTINRLTQVFDLSLEVEIGPVFMAVAAGTGIMTDPGRLAQTLGGPVVIEWPSLNITQADGSSIRDLCSKLIAAESKYENFGQLLRQLQQLKSLPSYSPLQFLGYFAILEALLTHNPKPADPYDSITRQVKNKINLLNNRWQPALDYTPFGGAKPDTVWNLMYSYRSAIAHGRPENIGQKFSGQFAALQDHSTAQTLVREAVKAILRHALEEPQLLMDLRDC